MVDTSDFVDEHWIKRGLGSSSAAAAAAAGITAQALGAPPEAPEIRPFLLAAATAAHAEHQGGGGSGADVAAAVYGGVIGFSLDAGAQRLPTPKDLYWAPVKVGPGGAPTQDFIRALRQVDPVSSRQVMAELSDAAEAAARAWVDARTHRFLQCIEAYRDALHRLGALIERPIVTPADLQLADIARSHGCAAKPSGAGGGEFAIVFAPTQEALTTTLQEAAPTPPSPAVGPNPPAPEVRPTELGITLIRPSAT